MTKTFPQPPPKGMVAPGYQSENRFTPLDSLVSKGSVEHRQQGPQVAQVPFRPPVNQDPPSPGIVGQRIAESGFQGIASIVDKVGRSVQGLRSFQDLRKSDPQKKINLLMKIK